MKTHLTWKKGLLKELYTIYKDGIQVGALKDSFGQTARGELYGASYLFKTKSFLGYDIEIIEEASQRIIGTITYKGLGTKADIILNGKTVRWKSESVWNTKWSMTDEAGINIQYSGSATAGHIDTDAADAAMVLAGLLITNYYWQLSLIVVILVIVIVTM